MNITELNRYAADKNQKLSKDYILRQPIQSLPERLHLATVETLKDPGAWLPLLVKSAKYNSILYSQMDRLAQAEKANLSDLYIIDSYQRDLMLSHVERIVRDFKPLEVNPVRVARSKKHGGKYIILDGQHTAIALWIIFHHVLGESDISIPVNIFGMDLEDLSDDEVRELFVGINTNSEKISHMDYHKLNAISGFNKQSVGKTLHPNETIAVINQIIAEKNGLFFTHEHKQDRNKPGAITRFNEWITKSQETKERFGKFWSDSGLNLNYAVDSTRVDILMEMFDHLSNADDVASWNEYENREVANILVKDFRFNFTKPGSGGIVNMDTVYGSCRLSFISWANAINPDHADYLISKFSTKYHLYAPMFLIEHIRKINPIIPLPSEKEMDQIATAQLNGYNPNENTPAWENARMQKMQKDNNYYRYGYQNEIKIS